MRKGYIQVYTGNAKGKTTAALGLALRAAGAGHRVYIAQFVKKRKCSEHNALERFSDLITVRQFGTGFIKSGQRSALSSQQKATAKKGITEVKSILSANQYDLVILDEINVATHYGLIGIQELLDLMNEKPSGVELVLTGRYADERVIEKADLVTEMKEIKHYFKKGIKARIGVEL